MDELAGKLLNEDESEFLDFKEFYHENKASLIHDILCMANSLHKGDRYILFGVQDKTKVISDLSNDQNRKNQTQIVDHLKGIAFNRRPSVSHFNNLKVEGGVVDLLVIHDRPEKPYFIRDDYPDRGKTVRSGVVYTRDKDTNTPLQKSSEDHVIEKMFRERLSLDKTPIERLEILLRSSDRWKYGYDEASNLYFYNLDFPEFTIIESSIVKSDTFMEPWCLEFPDKNATKTQFFLKYHGTILRNLFFVNCDGANLLMVLPDTISISANGIDYQSFYFIRNSLKCLVNEMIDATYRNNSHHYIKGSINYLENGEDLELLFSNDLDQSVPSMTYYFFNEDDSKYYRKDSTGNNELFKREDVIVSLPEKESFNFKKWFLSIFR